MKIEHFKPINFADLIYLMKDAFEKEQVQGMEALHDRYVRPRDAQIRSLTTMSQGQIGPGNQNVEIKELEVFHDEPVEFSLTTLRGRPIGAWPILTGIFEYPNWATEILDTARMKMKFFWNSAPITKVPVTVWVQGGD